MRRNSDLAAMAGLTSIYITGVKCRWTFSPRLHADPVNRHEKRGGGEHE
jgi:hypothetical protein